MTKQEYMTKLSAELKKNNVADANEIITEYEQHFLFKLADGYAEEEIAAKLAAPAQIAIQFAGLPGERKRTKGKKAFIVLGLSLTGIFEIVLYAAFFCFIAALFCATLAPAALGAELIAGVNFMNLLPPMPYSAAVIMGVMLLSLSVLLFIAALFCFAFLRQIVRASLRWRKNLLGKEALPPLPLSPQFSPKAKRAIRGVFLWAVMIFGIASVAGYTLLMLETQSWEFWHALGWFGYTAG